MPDFSFAATRLCLALLALGVPAAHGQSAPQALPTAAPPNAAQAPGNAPNEDANGDADSDPDGAVVGDRPALPRTPKLLRAEAWRLLSTAVADPKRPDTRIQALAALGLMGANPRSLKLIETAMKDKDVDVETAALLAAGQTRATAIRPAMRRQLDSRQPQVAYAAAQTLWKMGDRTGEDILTAVIAGDRRASPTLIDGTEHDIDKTLHSPATLARIGMMQGAGMLLGPFGFGITAYEYIKKNGGDSARVSALEALSEEKSSAIRTMLLQALEDRDLAMRAAATRALGSYHGPDVSAAIATLFNDPKQPVRLTAAAAYLIASGASPASPKPGCARTARPQ